MKQSPEQRIVESVRKGIRGRHRRRVESEYSLGVQTWREADAFTKGYLEALMWAAPEYENPAESARDKVFDDIAPETLQRVIEDCKKFQEENADLLDRAYNTVGYGPEFAGHDFALTRNGHGAGFWDREFDDSEVDKPQSEDYMISGSGSLGNRLSVGVIEGHHLGEFADWDEALGAIRDDVEVNQSWPNVWYQDDHGGIHGPVNIETGEYFEQKASDLSDKLTDAAEAFGEFDLYVGDDGKVYAESMQQVADAECLVQKWGGSEAPGVGLKSHKVYSKARIVEDEGIESQAGFPETAGKWVPIKKGSGEVTGYLELFRNQRSGRWVSIPGTSRSLGANGQLVQTLQDESVNKPEKYLLMTYETWDEDSLEAGETDKRGYAEPGGWQYPGVNGAEGAEIDMMPDEYDVEEGLTPVDMVVRFISDHLGSVDSASFPQTSFYGIDPDRDYETGEETYYAVHLYGFDEDELQRLYAELKHKRLMASRRRTGRSVSDARQRVRRESSDWDLWREDVDSLLRKRYGLSLDENDVDEDQLRDAFEHGETPFEFVTWFGEKYDLTTMDDIIDTWGRRSRTVRSIESDSDDAPDVCPKCGLVWADHVDQEYNWVSCDEVRQDVVDSISEVAHGGGAVEIFLGAGERQVAVGRLVGNKVAVTFYGGNMAGEQRVFDIDSGFDDVVDVVMGYLRGLQPLTQVRVEASVQTGSKQHVAKVVEGSVLSVDNVRDRVRVKNIQHPEWGEFFLTKDRNGWVKHPLARPSDGSMLYPSEFRFWEVVDESREVGQDCNVGYTTAESRKVSELKIRYRDRAVIQAFANGKKGESSKLYTDGQSLDGLWIGGNGIAQWVDGKIHISDTGSKVADTIVRVLVKCAPKNDFDDEAQQLYF